MLLVYLSVLIGIVDPVVYVNLPLWRNLRLNTPFGGQVITNGGIVVPSQTWIKRPAEIEVKIGADSNTRLLFIGGEQAFIRDKYGIGVAKVTQIKSLDGGASDYWLVKEIQK